MARPVWLLVIWVFNCFFILPSKGQFDPAMIITALSTSLSLVKYIQSLWKIIVNEQPGINTNSFMIPKIPGPIPDINFDPNNVINLVNNTDLIALLATELHSDRAILSQFAALTKKLSGLETRFSIIENSMAKWSHQLPTFIQWELRIDRLMSMMQPIHSSYDTFR